MAPLRFIVAHGSKTLILDLTELCCVVGNRGRMKKTWDETSARQSVQVKRQLSKGQK